MLLITFIAALLLCQPMLAACQDQQEQTTTIYFHMPRRQELEQRMLSIAESHGNWLTLEELSEYTRINKTVKDQAETAFRGREYTWNGRGNILRINGSHAVPQHLDRHVMWTSISDKKTARVAGDWPDLRTNHHQAVPQSVRPTAANDTICQEGTMTPPCLRQLYNFADYKSKADDPSIGVLAVTHPNTVRGFRQSDLDAYLKLYRPDIAPGSYKPRVIEAHGGHFSENSGSSEGILDVSVTSALAAPIPLQFLVIGQADPMTDIFATTFDVLTDRDDRPSVFLMAYGQTERLIKNADAATAMCELAVQLTALGTTLVVASGDAGVYGAVSSPRSAGDCPPFNPSYPSGCPWILSVGGLHGLKPERVVNLSGQGYWSGGGFSNYFPRPSWQEPAVGNYIKNHTVVPHTNFNEKGRGFPDVAAQGGDHDIIVQGLHTVGDGTSAAVNTVAAMIGLLNSARKRVGKGTVGWVHPLLYKSAPSIFRDITEGGIYGCGLGENATNPKLGFTADKGWDPASGLGAIDFEKMRRVFGA